MPRSETPWVVGCATRLLVRRKRLNVGTCRSTSSASSAGDASIASLVRTLTLAGTSPSRCSVRVGVTVTVSSSVAGSTDDFDRVRSRLDAFCVFSAKPPARTTMVTSPVSGVSMVKRPSGPVNVCRSAPDAGRDDDRRAGNRRRRLESCTTPESDEAARASMNAAITCPPTVRLKPLPTYLSSRATRTPPARRLRRRRWR